MLNHYLNMIQEGRIMTRNANAPCAAYETVYGKKCPHIMGRYPKSHKTQLWNGILVDGNLNKKWLHDLNQIKQIEMRSSCEGHDENWLSYIIFRLRDSNLEKKPYLDQLVSKIEKTDSITKSAWVIGKQGRPRIVVAAKTWFGQPDWKNWWDSLASRIKQVF